MSKLLAAQAASNHNDIAPDLYRGCLRNILRADCSPGGARGWRNSARGLGFETERAGLLAFELASRDPARPLENLVNRKEWRVGNR